MDDKQIAAQLRQPSGETGRLVAEKMNEGNAFLYRMAFEQMRIAATDHVLEIGFGNGNHLGEVIALTTSGFVAGVDFSEEMVREATERNRDALATGQLEIKLGSISAIPYPGNRFDKIYTLNTIYFWEHPLDDAREILRVLKPGGTLYVGLRTAQTMKNLSFTQHGFTLYEIPDVTTLLQQAGFADIHTERRFEPDHRLDSVVVRATRP